MRKPDVIGGSCDGQSMIAEFARRHGIGVLGIAGDADGDDDGHQFSLAGPRISAWALFCLDFTRKCVLMEAKPKEEIGAGRANRAQ